MTSTATPPQFGDPRISYRYASDTSSPAEPNLRGADGEQINDDAQSLLVDGKVALTLEVPWSEERGQPEYWTDRELYAAYIESIAGDRTANTSTPAKPEDKADD